MYQHYKLLQYKVQMTKVVSDEAANRMRREKEGVCGVGGRGRRGRKGGGDREGDSPAVLLCKLPVRGGTSLRAEAFPKIRIPLHVPL